MPKINHLAGKNIIIGYYPNEDEQMTIRKGRVICLRPNECRLCKSNLKEGYTELTVHIKDQIIVLTDILLGIV